MPEPENAGENLVRNARGQFTKGASGNPAGKPVGTRSRATRAAQAMLDGEAEALTRKAVKMALDGDSVALRLCLERVCPPCRERLIDPDAVSLPKEFDAQHAPEILAGIVRAVARGRLTTSEGTGLSGLVRAYLESCDWADIARRLDAVEDAARDKRRW